VAPLSLRRLTLTTLTQAFRLQLVLYATSWHTLVILPDRTS
jgi:hypothetical protein